MESPSNPEDDLLARIDALEADDDAALITESIRRGPTDDYHAPYKARCPHCGGEWHGLPVGGDCTGGRQRGCPGAHATAEQVAAFKDLITARRKLVPMTVADTGTSYMEAVELATAWQRMWLENWVHATPAEKLSAMARPRRVTFERRPTPEDVAFKLSAWFESLAKPIVIAFACSYQCLDGLDSTQPFMSKELATDELPLATGWWAHFQGCRAPNLAVYLRRRGERTLGPWIAMGGDDDPPWQRHG